MLAVSRELLVGDNALTTDEHTALTVLAAVLPATAAASTPARTGAGTRSSASAGPTVSQQASDAAIPGMVSSAPSSGHADQQGGGFVPPIPGTGYGSFKVPQYRPTDGDKVVCDVCEFEQAPLFPMPDGTPGDPSKAVPRLTRWTFDLGRNSDDYSVERLSEEGEGNGD